jgi:hypothetical protein
MLKDEFHNPESLKCIHMVNKMANDYWELYTSGNGVVNMTFRGTCSATHCCHQRWSRDRASRDEAFSLSFS